MEKPMRVAIVQARMASSRLPGKVMREVMGKPLIAHMLERLKFSQKIEKIVVATSTDPSNDALCVFLQSQGVEVYRGSEEDVLDRFYQAAKLFGASTVVRLTADCPLIDYKIVDQVIEKYETGVFDHVVTAGDNPGYPDGLDVEAFSFVALETAWREADKASEREHVTPYIKTSGRFRTDILRPERDHSAERWTVDNDEDLAVVTNILKELYRPGKYFGMKEVLDYQLRHPEAFEMNRHIQRNEGYAKSLARDRKLGPRAGGVS